MYSSSTQRKFWTFPSLDALQHQKSTSWRKYEESVANVISNELLPNELPTDAELQKLLDYYVCFLRDLCAQFQPPPPPSVFGTAVVYFKRFYLNTSPMEYHPKDVAYLCLYLAAKVDEYNVSFGQFIQQIAPNYEQVGDFVITNELLLMQKLHFHLTVHNAYRPLEGFILDLKSRFRDIAEVERYRQNAEVFIAKALLADTFLIYTPSQVALASLKASIGTMVISYIDSILAVNSSETSKLVEKLDEIIGMVKIFKVPPREVADDLIQKLELCRNQEHNPMSKSYRANEKFAHEQKEKAKQERYDRRRELLGDKVIDGVEPMTE